MKREALKKFVEKVEIFLALVLFFVMLITCGMYIDIRINGQSSSLPPIPAGVKEVLLKTGSVQKMTYSDDLIEPVFIGFKDEGKQICATFDSEIRQSLENATAPYLFSLFEGTFKKVEFTQEDGYDKLLKQIKEADKYVVISYFSDIPASVFLPCLSSDVRFNSSNMDFFVRHIFMLSDENMNTYGLAFSSDKKVYKLIPDQSVSFDKITAYEYDVNDGLSYFTYSSESSVIPVFESSFLSNKFKLDSLSDIYGNDIEAKWVSECFDVFDINENLVKSYSFKNDAEIVYVDDERELLVSDDGFVEFNSGSSGVYLENILGYGVSESGSYLLSDKIVAIKKIVNVIKPENDLTDCGIIGVDYDEKNNQLSIYLKYFVNGIAVSENGYDAVFRIVENELVYAKFGTFLCETTDEVCVFVNQKYMNSLLDGESAGTVSENIMYFAVLEKEENGKYYVPKNATAFNID